MTIEDSKDLMAAVREECKVNLNTAIVIICNARSILREEFPDCDFTSQEVFDHIEATGGFLSLSSK